MKRKYNETMIVRDGKLAYAIILDNKSNGNHSTYIYIRDGKIYFSQDSWFTSTRFDFEDETHRISKEIFVNQLQTDIKTRVLELKQLQEVFNELDLAECLDDIIPTSAKLLGELKQDMYLALDEKFVQINKNLDEKVENQIEENVKPIARRRKKKAENKE